MSRYVFLHRESHPRREDVEKIANAPGVTILDDTLDRAILLDGPEDVIETLRGDLHDWIVEREVTYPPPAPAAEQLNDDGG